MTAACWLTHRSCLSSYSQFCCGAIYSFELDCSGKAEKQQHAQVEEELNTGGKVWLGCAVAAVAAFCLFSGQYITIGGAYEYEDEDDADDI